MNTVTDDDLQSISETIWGTLFTSTLERATVPGPEVHREVTGLVHIDGAWQGALMLRCSTALAAMVTAAMFESVGEPPEEDVRDAVGELTNMMAGNVKALLPEPCAISLPSVALGADYAVRVMGAEPVAEVAFACGGEPLSVTLLHNTRAPGSS